MKRWIEIGLLGAIAATALSLALTAQGGQPTALRVKVPEFQDIAEWVNTKPLAVKDLRGHVVVVHFWTFGCINCIHNYPSYKGWHDRYAKQGVTVIGIHTPELPGEADIARVRQKVTDNGMAYPIAIDNGSKTWAAWGNRYWPCVYLIDKKGFIRYRWEGELNANDAKGEEVMRQAIEELLAEKG